MLSEIKYIAKAVMLTVIALLTGTVLLTGLAFCSLNASAQPVAKPYLVLYSQNGQIDTLYAGDQAPLPFQAPLRVCFFAGFQNVEAASLRPEWRVERSWQDQDGDSGTEEYLTRKTEQTDYMFNDFGSFSIDFSYSFSLPGDDDFTQGDSFDPFRFSIDNSTLSMPNAFSPNGDGINDIFIIKTKSIVSISVSIFDRYGRVIKTADQNSMPFRDDVNGGYYECWDGTSGGRQVQDGVYYINVRATGAGGYRYNLKKDINILTGTSVNYER